MKYLLLLILPIIVWASSDFISPQEYAAQLYKNPRGIGCQHCHGENGEGKIIAKYKHKSIERKFTGPKINNISYSEFYRALNRRKKAMPRYFLTDKEVQALYLHLHKNDKVKKKNAK